MTAQRALHAQVACAVTLLQFCCSCVLASKVTLEHVLIFFVSRRGRETTKSKRAKACRKFICLHLLVSHVGNLLRKAKASAGVPMGNFVNGCCQLTPLVRIVLAHPGSQQ